MDIESIYNYVLLADNMATSGQPIEEELSFIVNSGYEIVVNLGLDDAEYSLKNEALFFNKRSVQYFHIPVIFQDPKESDLSQFMELLEKYREKRIFIHCAANKRASVFIALYRVIKLGWQESKALSDIGLIWEPNGIWQSFINHQLTNNRSASDSRRAI